MDPYRVLEVDKSASDEEIKASFRRLAKRWHPDRNPDDQEAELRFKEIGQAYKVLSDPHQRAELDRGGWSVPIDIAPGDYGLSDLLGDLFATPPDRSGSFPDLEDDPDRLRVKVPMASLESGGVISVPVGARKVKVRVPAGSRDGTRLRVTVEGRPLILILQASP